MEPIGGDLAGHDHEFEEVRWIPFAEAAAILTFETERALVARAAELVDRRRRSGRRLVTDEPHEPAATGRPRSPSVTRRSAPG